MHDDFNPPVACTTVTRVLVLLHESNIQILSYPIAASNRSLSIECTLHSNYAGLVPVFVSRDGPAPSFGTTATRFMSSCWHL